MIEEDFVLDMNTKIDEAAELTRHSFYVKAPTLDIDEIMREAR